MKISGALAGQVIDRRVKGVLLLAVVLLAAVAISGLTAHRLAGAPSLGPIPIPPHVGQCLLQNPAVDSTRGSGTSYRLGKCTTRHYGEVAEVVSAADISSRSTGDLTAAATCSDESAYLGWTAPVKVTPQVQWRPINLTVMAMDPTPVQRAFGQHWVVCVVSPATAGAGYTGSVRGAFTSGTLPSTFAQCASSPSAAQVPVPCDRPHRFEIFGIADLSTAFRDQQAVDADCLVLARSAMRRADPTAGGALSIRALPFHWNAAGDLKPGLATGPTDLGAEALCTAGVNGTRLLGGTLFGLGERVLPWD